MIVAFGRESAAEEVALCICSEPFPFCICYLRAVLDYSNIRVKLMMVLLQFNNILKWILIVALHCTVNCICIMLLQI